VVADSPFADFGEMIERQYSKLSHLPAFFLPGALAVGRWLAGVDYRRIRPIEAARRLSGRPLLVIHSQHDRFIPACDSEAIARSASGSLWITNTRGHIGSYRSDPAGYSARGRPHERPPAGRLNAHAHDHARPISRVAFDPAQPPMPLTRTGVGYRLAAGGVIGGRGSAAARHLLLSIDSTG
jgi:fermentation-respiration switch protein FrsA (DUF1100 family)